MPPRRRSLESRFPAGPLLALSAACLWGCPQLLSDEFKPDGNSPSLSDDDPSDDGNGSAGTGNASAGTGSGTGGTGSGVGGAGAPVTQPGAPSVVSVSPSDGASGVPADAAVSLIFSEPMDTSAVEAAYSSTDLPANAVTFSWSNGDTELQITPNQPMTLASGTAPASPAARSYTFEIGPAAVDLGGDALAPFSSSFTTLREISVTLDALQDRSLSGNYRSDDVYGNNSCVEVGSTTTCIGDSSNDNSTYRGFVTFDLSALPIETQDVSAAQLDMSIDTIRGTPFGPLGSLVVEHLRFDSINLATFSAPALGPAITVSSSASIGSDLSVSVLSAVQQDAPSRAHSQFRLRFTTDTDSNDTGDLIEILSTTEELTVKYLIP